MPLAHASARAGCRSPMRAIGCHVLVGPNFQVLQFAALLLRRILHTGACADYEPTNSTNYAHTRTVRGRQRSNTLSARSRGTNPMLELLRCHAISNM